MLPCTTKYYCVLQSTTTNYSVLLQYYPVLQSTTQVLLCTTKYYSSTNLYYKVLLQYYPVLQSTTPVLPCTTKYYSNTTLYYKVLLQYYSVLQSTTPILLRTYPVLQSTTQVLLQYYLSTTPLLPCRSASHMKRHLQCAEQQKAASNFSKYCACHAKWISWLIRIAYETSFTMRGATKGSLQLHQILRLPRKMNLMIDPHHIWNVIYNARSNRQHPPTSPNTAPATHNECHDWATSQMKRHLQCAEQHSTPSNLTKYCACHAKWISHMKRHLQCAEQQATPSNLTKYCACHAKWPPKIRQKIAENRWNVISNARPIRAWSDHDPSMIRPWSGPDNAKLNPPRRQGYFSHWPGADSIENYNVSRSGYHSKFHQMLHLPQKVTHELHQMLHLPQKVTRELHQMLHLPRIMNVMIEPHHRWNVIYNAQSNRQHPPTSPNIAPATHNDCHDWGTSQMKRHLQCAEQQATPSNLTKYCACHAKWPPKTDRK